MPAKAPETAKKPAAKAEVKPSSAPVETELKKVPTELKKPASETSEPDWIEILGAVEPGVAVFHKVFGDGQVVKIDNAKKHIAVKFQKGENTFIFPNAFIDGFLTLKDE